MKKLCKMLRFNLIIKSFYCTTCFEFNPLLQKLIRTERAKDGQIPITNLGDLRKKCFPYPRQI